LLRAGLKTLQGTAVASFDHLIGLGEDRVRDGDNVADHSREPIVLDPFLGSGSTLMAAEKARRTCRGVEIDPLYVDVVLRRFEAATGIKPLLVPA
jgi:hypothetical protein